MKPNSIHPALQPWLDLGAELGAAGWDGAKRTLGELRPRRRGAFRSRQPGPETPAWNACVVLLRRELAGYGAQARLARFLGVPRQRLNDFVRGRRRLPDAEVALQLLFWLAERRAGRDPAL